MRKWLQKRKRLAAAHFLHRLFQKTIFEVCEFDFNLKSNSQTDTELFSAIIIP